MFLVSAFCLEAVGFAAGADDSGAEALAKLRTLAGSWEGTFQWTGARTDAGQMNATYYVTGYGSAVVENLGDTSSPSMTSVYHLDGADLRMTHYCGTQNQPRLKARRIDLAQGIVEFSFVDITNVRSPDAPHVHGVEIQFRDADHLTLTFLFSSTGKESRERIELKRVAPRTTG
jgi:hypothetical protein